MTKPLGKIGTIGHIDHGKTTIATPIALQIAKAKHDVVVIAAENEPEEGRSISSFAPKPFVIKNYNVPMPKIQITGRQKRNQRRKKTKKNGRNRK